MEDSLMEATGINGKVLLFKNVVRIKRIGIGSFLSGTSRIEKDILISQIASIQFKKAGLLNNGYIEFILLHNHERHDKDSEYEIYDSIVTFRPGQQRAFEAFREALEAKLTGGLNKGAISGYHRLGRTGQTGLIAGQGGHHRRRVQSQEETPPRPVASSFENPLLRLYNLAIPHGLVAQRQSGRLITGWSLVRIRASPPLRPRAVILLAPLPHDLPRMIRFCRRREPVVESRCP